MNMLTAIIKKIRAKLRHWFIGHLSIENLQILQELESIKLAIGKHEARTVTKSQIKSIQDAEFRIFSQFGEDGIIQYLINKISIKNNIFVELGVGDYSESNTRFLLMNNNWQGNIINSGNDHINFIHDKKMKDFVYRYDIQAISAFITTKNINNIIKKLNIPQDIGLLSIDLDGNDYWIWKAIDTISPRIVIVEYNSTFGTEHAITIPYKSDFDRSKAHFSNLYFGASLSAFNNLAEKKGYKFVGCCSAGINAFFIRKDFAKTFPKLNIKKGFIKSNYRESKDEHGNFTLLSKIEERLSQIKNEKIYNILDEETTTIKKIFNIT